MALMKSYGGSAIHTSEDVDAMFQRNAGIYNITVGNMTHFGSTWDLSRAKREQLELLAHGFHPHFWLQEQFKIYGLRGTTFQVVEVVNWPKSTIFSKSNWQSNSIKAKRAYTIRSSSGTVPERTPGFSYKSFERRLAKFLEFHHVNFLKSELKIVMKIYRRKLIVPKLKKWKTIVAIERLQEDTAAAMQIQRVYRGFVARQAILRRKRFLAIPTIQRYYRGHLGRKKIAFVRRRNLRNYASNRIQKTWRIHVAQNIVNVLRRHKRLKRKATDIQRVYRGYLGREKAYHVKLVKAVLRVQTSWRAHHGRLGYQLKKRARETKRRWENEGAIEMQRIARGWLGRRLFAKLEHERLVYAVIRVQTAWRCKNGQYTYHLLQKAKKERAAHDLEIKLAAEAYALELERAAVKIQCAWRRKKGQLAYHLKLQAKQHQDAEDKNKDEAAHTIQMWWHHVNGNFAARLKARAEVELRRHDRDYKEKRRQAVLKIQAWYRGCTGRMGYHLKQRALAHQEEEYHAASRIQLWWHHMNGNFAANLKARAELQLRRDRKKEKEEMKKLEQAVIRVQSRWRMKQGRFAYHLKMRARKAEIARVKALEDAALRVQSAWRKKKGEWAKHMKMRAREADRLQKEYENRMALRIQMGWRRMKGNFAYHLKMQARKADEEHRKMLDNAAHRIQMWWHHQQGNFAAKFKARAEVERRRHEKEIDEAAHRIQMWWHRQQGNLAKRIRMRAEKHMAELHAQEELAALKIQARWRARKGQLAYHMKRKAIRELSKHVHDWIEYFDDWACIPYWHSEEVNLTVFEKPANYNPDFSAYYEEYDYENSLWGYVNLHTKKFVYILPKGAHIVEKPKPPKPPRTYVKKNGYWRHKLRKPLTKHDKWLHKRDTLKGLVFGGINAFDAKAEKAKAEESRKKIKRQGATSKLTSYLPPLPKAKPHDDAEKINNVVEDPRTKSKEIKLGQAFPKIIASKQDLHDYLVKKYAKKTALHNKGSLLLKPANVDDRIKIKLWVGGTDSLNHLKYYPGIVTEAHLDGTYNLFLDDGVRKHDVRRDEFVFEFEEEFPTPRSVDGLAFEEEDDEPLYG